MAKLKLFILKHKKILLTAADIFIIPALFLCEKITDGMIATGKPCSWTYFGLQCATCGGTRCTNNFLNGNFFAAYMLNPMLFVAETALIFIFVMLQLDVFFKLAFAKKTLHFIFNIKTLYFCLAVFLTFFVARNFIPFIELLWK